MSIATPQLPELATLPTDWLFRISVERYHEMIAAGILTGDDRVELLEGILVKRMSKNPRHRTAILKLQQALPRLLPDGVFPQYQDSITLNDSEPEPDGVVVQGTIEQFATQNPGPAFISLVIEVADRSLRQDRGVKRRMYAEAGIAVYWIVNLPDRVIEVFSDPIPATGEYQSTKVFQSGESVPVLILGRQVGVIAVNDLLP